MHVWTLLWPVIIAVLIGLGRFGEWQWFYLILTGATIAHAFLPVRVRQGRKLAWGACIMLVSYICSIWFLEIMDYKAALIPHSVVNTVVAIVFLVITWFNRSFWSAICVALHAAMILWAYWYFTHPQTPLHEFQQILNGLYVAAHFVINLAIYAGGQKWGEQVDGVLSRHTGLSFTGLGRRRLYSR